MVEREGQFHDVECEVTRKVRMRVAARLHSVSGARHALFLRLNLRLCSGAVKKKQTTKQVRQDTMALFARPAAEFGLCFSEVGLYDGGRFVRIPAKSLNLEALPI